MELKQNKQKADMKKAVRPQRECASERATVCRMLRDAIRFESIRFE